MSKHYPSLNRDESRYSNSGRRRYRILSLLLLLIGLSIAFLGWYLLRIFVVPENDSVSNKEVVVEPNQNEPSKELENLKPKQDQWVEEVATTDSKKVNQAEELDLSPAIQAQFQQYLNNKNYIMGKKWGEEELKKLTPKSKAWYQCADALTQLNCELLMGNQSWEKKRIHHLVVGGDTLIGLAKKYNTTVEMIQKSNKLKETSHQIMLGSTLKIWHGDWKVVVKKEECRLYLYDGDSLFATWPVCVGLDGRTPTGLFKISEKVIEPDWYDNGIKYEFGKKENILGTRWLTLSLVDEQLPKLTGYGIHGTWAPETVGKALSNGCVRMINKDVEILFDILPYGIQVLIE